MQEVGVFKANADRDKIVVSREGSRLTFAPSDLRTVSRLLSMAMSYCKGKVLPPKLQWGNFEFTFSEEGEHTLGRVNEEGGLVVAQNDGDDLINILSAALSSHVDAVRLTSGPRRGASRGSPDPVITGRE